MSSLRRRLLFLFASLSLLPSSPSLPTIGLDAFHSEQSRLDPVATKDTYTLLPTSLKRSPSLSSPLPPVPSLVSSLLSSLQIPFPLHVRLVGPSFLSSAPSLLSSFVSAAAPSSSHFHSIAASGSHALSVSHSLHLHPSLSPLSLSSSISSAIKSHLDSSPSPLHRSSLHPVPYSLVDRLVRSDFLSHSPSASPPGALFLYLLYPDLPRPRPYAYSYEEANATRDPSPAFSKCLGSIWTGAERYAWIDLAAGPVDYGPALSGEGLLPRGEFHPLASLHKKTPASDRALLADLASLVLSAYRTLLVPSLRIPVFFQNSLLVQFVHIRAGGSDAPDSRRPRLRLHREVDKGRRPRVRGPPGAEVQVVQREARRLPRMFLRRVEVDELVHVPIPVRELHPDRQRVPRLEAAASGADRLRRRDPQGGGDRGRGVLEGPSGVCLRSGLR
ncbi:uncharacterized protein M6B38_232885 [Iris pallida]|uniref:DUF7906 domain-containing protein n=1 Tax=Iris pallida TaxID=29817 RepID=A0AAX6DQD0_IRIPA|nr:uncharacterized protein M6B38_232885 [Iris pallida]